MKKQKYHFSLTGIKDVQIVITAKTQSSAVVKLKTLIPENTKFKFLFKEIES